LKDKLSVPGLEKIPDSKENCVIPSENKFFDVVLPSNKLKADNIKSKPFNFGNLFKK